ncbi:MAG: succinate dehydrogenase, cytochrome b556 subunit [Hyphomicrobiaceae bacterium]
MAHSKSAAGRPVARPLSPHLQIYAKPINMVMSILHRITGVALYFGTLLLAWWLIAAATSPAYFNFVNGLFGTLLGRLVLFGYTWALLHHMLGGIRHLIWDTGRGFDLKTVDRLGWGTIIGSVVLTILVWIAAIGSRGIL